MSKALFRAAATNPRYAPPIFLWWQHRDWVSRQRATAAPIPSHPHEAAGWPGHPAVSFRAVSAGAQNLGHFTQN